MVKKKVGGHLYRYRKSVKKYRNEGATIGCVFCNQSDNVVLEETELAYVMRSNFSYDVWEYRDVVEHLLIIPKRHVESLAGLTDAEQAEIIKIAGRYEADKYNIYARAVASVTRTVPSHQHTHLIKTTDRPPKAGVYIAKPHLLYKL